MSAMPRVRSADGVTDAELLTAIDGGDISALGVLFDRYHARVRRAVGRAGMARADADDVVQATFLELRKIARSFDGRTSAGAWICGVAIRLAARRRRSFVRMLGTLASFGRISPSVDLVDPETTAGDREELARFRDALAELAPKKRDVFLLVEVEGMTAEDAARSLGIPAATARTRLFHARAHFRERVHRRAR